MTNLDGDTGVPPAADSGGPVDFRLLTPANWYVLDLNPATRSGSLARLVESRFGATDDPRLVQARRELTAVLRGAAREAEESGAVYAALMDTMISDVALSASVLAVVGPAPTDDDGNVVTDPRALSATLLAAELTSIVDSATGTPPEAGDDSAEIVELPAGPAVRLRRATDTGLAGSTGETAKAAETQYFLPVPRSDQLLVLTFATPNVDFRTDFDELFDRIAETVEWQWAAEPA